MAEDKSNLDNLHKSLRKGKSKFPMILCIIMLIAFSALGAFNAIETQTTYFDEVQATQFIYSQDDLINNMSSLYNDKIILKNDITIDEEIIIGTKENPFQGVFDGNGYEITLKTTTSLFGHIGKTGKVTELNLKYDNSVSVEDCFAPVAIENKGIIENCYIKSNISITGGEVFSSVAVYNKGTIKNCYVDSTYSKETSNDESNSEMLIGGISVVNGGNILNTISIIKFGKNIPQTIAQNIYSGDFVNITIGGLTSINQEKSQNINNVMIISKDTFVCDINSKIKILYSIEELTKNIFYDELCFSLDFWEYGKLITLKRGVSI